MRGHLEGRVRRQEARRTARSCVSFRHFITRLAVRRLSLWEDSDSKRHVRREGFCTASTAGQDMFSRCRNPRRLSHSAHECASNAVTKCFCGHWARSSRTLIGKDDNDTTPTAKPATKCLAPYDIVPRQHPGTNRPCNLRAAHSAKTNLIYLFPDSLPAISNQIRGRWCGKTPTAG